MERRLRSQRGNPMPGCQEHGCFGRMVKRIHNGHEATVQFLRYAAEWIADSKDAGTFEAALTPTWPWRQPRGVPELGPLQQPVRGR